jgi:hypothetical protein
LQFDSEYPDQQNADQEGGQRHADERNGHDRARQPAAPVKRRIDPETHSHNEGQGGGDQRQFQCRRQARQDEFHHRLLQPVGDAEITRRGAADIAGELDDNRIVQAQPVAQCFTVSLACLLPHHRRDGIADEAEQRKRHQSHNQHHEHGLHDPAQDIGDHRKPRERTGPEQAGPAAGLGRRGRGPRPAT